MREVGEDWTFNTYLARWDKLGFFTLYQLQVMVNIIDARAAMGKVEEAIEWIEG